MQLVDEVLRRLGTPPGFYRADARAVGPLHHRVNIWITKRAHGAVIGTESIVHSFFVTVDSDQIVASDPPIPEGKYPATKREDRSILELQGTDMGGTPCRSITNTTCTESL